MMQDELISIDQLEDQIIDHPDASTEKELHESLDETFQKKLNARAERLPNDGANSLHAHHHHHHHHESNSSSSGSKNDDNSTGGRNDADIAGPQIGLSFLITKSHLQYEYQEIGSLETEINEWFTLNDLKILGGLSNMYQLYERSHEGNDITLFLKRNIEVIDEANLLDTNAAVSISLKILLYFAFGEYATKKTRQQQLDQIKKNSFVLLQLQVYKPLIRLIKDLVDKRIEFDKDIDTDEEEEQSTLSQKVEADYFKVLTLLFFLTQVNLQDRDNEHSIEFRKYLGEVDFLTTIFRFIEHWKWYPNNSYRIRYLITLVNNLILFELGGATNLKACDNFLVDLHQIKNKKGRDLGETVLTCSPLDYFAFREDLLDKFPLYENTELKAFDFTEFTRTLEREDDIDDTSSIHSHESTIEGKYKYFMAVNSFSNSLSNLMETPKTTKSHTVLSQLPTQTVHIATPVPSPTFNASDYMSGGEKVRRSYQVNQAMPFIYPNLPAASTQQEVDDESPSSTVTVPLAMKEADEILKNSIYESYSIKRLWNEREKFMIQERGYVNEYQEEQPKDEFDYDYDDLKQRFPEKMDVIELLQRVDKMYAANVSRLYTVVEVLMETIKVNRMDYNLNFAELELNPETSFLSRNGVPTPGDAKLKSIEQTKEKIRYVLTSQLEVLNVKEITLKASTNIVLLLLKWFKISHVLKYYYLSSILFDQQFFTVALDYLSRSFNNANLQSLSKDEAKKDDLTEYEILINQNKLMNPKVELPTYDFFNNCLQVFPDGNYRYKFINKEFISTLPEQVDANNINHVYIKHYNSNFAFILSNMLKITNKILIKNQTQRIFTLNDLKPSELYKMILMNYDNDAFTKPILKTLKKLIPYQGRKWKSINMDLISQIYLNLKLSMKDHWLSGKDLESDFNNSYDQEIALRGLLQFYNMRNFPKQMEKIGYQVNHDLDIPVMNLNDEDDGYF
ncbi:factor arrest protein 11 [Spathaspora passalidarum NRRL Y-27907]|uniref:Factor arrest protein 11 n=1 Tax=Spathaspora passalidarum (strain NRRL Y-27907 / 11-Y1) TaxID=619300 RepID=G3AUX3_SPAPN|nr:factor arrest protein 11 [Spathaspora passalidarum NRRL Y-27907]EGW30064.1 factor arrest protein 11 [Spathaspora passalidarum NRRL Y-27907]